MIHNGVLEKCDALEAAHINAGVIDRTRPLCAYPTTAPCNGAGSTDDAKNYGCQ